MSHATVFLTHFSEPVLDVHFGVSKLPFLVLMQSYRVYDDILSVIKLQITLNLFPLYLKLL